MGESTTRRCVSYLTKGLVHCHAPTDIYLRRPSRSDARKIVALHERVHKLPGMMGSLDVTKVHWKRCPTAWKGQFQGREKFPSIGLEAVVDNNLCFWHAAFGFSGTLNDINIWERSSVYKSMINGFHDKLDFKLMVDSVVFNNCFTLSMVFTLNWHVFSRQSLIPVPDLRYALPKTKKVTGKMSSVGSVCWSLNFYPWCTPSTYITRRHILFSPCTDLDAYRDGWGKDRKRWGRVCKSLQHIVCDRVWEFGWNH